MPKKETKNLTSKVTKEVITNKAVSDTAKNVKKSTKSKSVNKKDVVAKKNTSTSVKKATTTSKKAVSKRNSKAKIEIVEYYDLPYRYNQTIVKVLYQTPSTLFIYWDISDIDRNNFINKFGENFFNETKPVLIIYNDTLHYSFEIEIDDFANSWYLHINDSNCKYRVELGRRPKQYNNNVSIPNNYLPITDSNEIEAPNDHVLFDKNLKTVYFKDVKTNIITQKAITSLSFMRMMGKIYSLYDLQTDFKKDTWMDANHWQLDLSNPSSSNPSSTFR